MLDIRFAAVKRQFEALGLTTGKVHIRALLPKVKATDKSNVNEQEIRKSLNVGRAINGRDYVHGAFKYVLNLATFEITSEGISKTGEPYKFDSTKQFLKDVDVHKYGAYFVTGVGGNVDTEINYCPSLFYECDEDSLEAQYEKLHTLEQKLGRKASLVVFTGGKSLHVYFTIQGGVPVAEFENWQKRLIATQKSDPAIINPARLMRLAAFNHYSIVDGELISKASEIIQSNSNVFTLEEFNSVLEQAPIEVKPEIVYEYSEQDSADTREFVLNVAQRLPGYSSKKRQKWATAKCPCNTGFSNDSLHINLATGKFKSHHGTCDNKFIWKELCNLADQVGIKQPERKHERKNKTISKEEFYKKFPVAKPEDKPKTESNDSDARNKAQASKLNALTYNPDLVVNQKYLPEMKELKAQLIAVSSATGSGKTERVKDAIELTAKVNPDRSVVNLSYRNALSMDTSKRLGLAHLHTVGKAFMQFPMKSLCVDSIHKLKVDQVQHGDLLIIDEVEAFIDHLVNGSTCKRNRGQIVLQFMRYLQAVIDKGGYILMMEANLTDVSIDLIRSIVGFNTSFYLIKNKYETIKYPVTFMRSKDATCITAKLLGFMGEGKKVMFVSNSQKECEKVHKILSKLYPNLKVVRIDGKTSETEESKEFLGDLNAEIERQDLFVLLLSPSLESGGNITTERFDFVLGVFTNTDSRRALQMLARLRTNVPRIIHVSANQKLNGSHLLSVDSMKDSLLQNETETDRLCSITNQESPKELLFDLARVEGSNWLVSASTIAKADSSTLMGIVLDTAIKLQVRANCSQVRLDQDLVEQYEVRGYEITFEDADVDAEVKELKKEAKEAIREEESDEMVEAGCGMTEGEAKDILNSPTAVREDRIKATQSLDYQRYKGEVEFDRPMLQYLYQKNNGGEAKKVQLLARMQNLEKSLTRERKYRDKTGGQLLTDKRYEHVKAIFLVETLGLLDLINSGEEFNSKSEKAIKILEAAKNNAEKVKQFFGLTITDKTTATDFISRICKSSLGLSLQNKRVSVNKKQQIIYWFDLTFDDCFSKIYQAEMDLLQHERYSPKPQLQTIEPVVISTVKPEDVQLCLAVA